MIDKLKERLNALYPHMNITFYLIDINAMNNYAFQYGEVKTNITVDVNTLNDANLYQAISSFVSYIEYNGLYK